jgi:FtsP/CotA-like multicopper oxidase with cupredoxin domain
MLASKPKRLERLEERDLMNEKAQETVERQGDFPADTSGLPRAVSPTVIELADGGTTELHIGPVVKRVGDADVRMLAYNGSIPGPTLKAPEGATVTVHVRNEGDLEATVHWHGLRLENRYDGTHDTQAPIPVGGTFTYQLNVPDPGAYWYHPHIREDYGQELGLYGNIHVVPADPDYWAPVNRELFLTLDDVLIEDGKIAGFSASETTHVAMGRFGNVMLVSGEPDVALTANHGEVVRFYFTNTANTRVFNVTLPGARMKLVGGDSGHYEHETFVDEVLLSPSERYVVDVLFERPGDYTLEHRTPARSYSLASITVGDEQAVPSFAKQFDVLRRNDDLAAERKRVAQALDAAPDKTLAFVAEMDFDAPEGSVYTCPMHPEVVSEEQGRCPKCGMKLLPMESPPTSYVCPMHPHVTSDSPDRCPDCGMKLMPAHLVQTSKHAGHGRDVANEEHRAHGSDSEHESAEPAAHSHEHAQGIEWEDDMVEVNRRTTAENTRWKLVDRDTGAANAAIDWKFRVGDQVKIRLVNEMDSDHPMPHPFHVHGAGRFLVVARDGVEEPNLVWKDTVLVRTGETVDILLDVTNPGRWMAHCHIAEHHESGMMFGFDVEP